MPAQTLTFCLTDAPTGASIDPTTGDFSWTPDESQGPGVYTFSVVVSDGVTSTSRSIEITVGEVNAVPMLSNVPANATIDELQPYTFTATASDTDLPAQTLAFSLISAPAGASIDAATGVFSWTPTESQGPGVFTFSVVVSDGVTTVSTPIEITVAEVNSAPQVNAGTDQSLSGMSANLDGTVIDDGGPAVLTTTWSKVSGPGNVVFGDASAIDTTALFGVAGTYVLRLTANDGGLVSSDDVSITAVGTTTTISFQDGLFPTASYAGTADTDIRSGTTAATNFGTANPLHVNGSPDQAILIRWDLSQLPSDSQVQSVTLTFNVSDASANTYEIYEMKRAWQEMQATWNSGAGGAWEVAGAQGVTDRGSTVLGFVTGGSATTSFNLNADGVAVVQNWLAHPEQNFGFIIQDYSATDDKFDIRPREASSAVNRPKLTITYGSTAATNSPPSVGAGPDQSISTLTANLDGTVSDDGIPSPLSNLWSVVSGPGSVVFGNASDVDTTATFGTAGTYVLRLTSNDGEFSRSDDVSITANPIVTTSISFQDGMFPTTGYLGTTDTDLRSNSSGTNFGTANPMVANGSPDQATIIRWDLSQLPQAGTTVQSVSLTLSVADGSTQTYEIYEMKRDWSESQATWDANAGGNWQIAGAQGTDGPSPDRGTTVLGTLTGGSGTQTFALNAAGLAVVQGWIQNPSTNFGFIIQDYSATSDGMQIRSREATTKSNRPKINITYTASSSAAAASSSTFAAPATDDGAAASERDRRDVNQDGLITPLDALLVINALNANHGASALLAPAGDSSLDVNSDHMVTALDALLVVNALNERTTANASASASPALVMSALSGGHAELTASAAATQANDDAIASLFAASGDSCQTKNPATAGSSTRGGRRGAALLSTTWLDDNLFDEL